ncbi:hypothetical protein IGI04_011941 [Brassica rapa subsp. trilocularis]|uniref:Uncharacterized protein n=1 Tax=Brassica rapa subsp. trilocularis TaxID=1813537 RepID=A0ABQ7N4I8_BRACM|nr:hypothetical protein IGI04_011941 [Brassica rapa subsp. trilocularis]
MGTESGWLMNIRGTTHTWTASTCRCNICLKEDFCFFIRKALLALAEYIEIVAKDGADPILVEVRVQRMTLLWIL